LQGAAVQYPINIARRNVRILSVLYICRVAVLFVANIVTRLFISPIGEESVRKLYHLGGDNLNSKDVLRKIELLGIKKHHVAMKCFIPTQIFSEYLNSKRLITQEQETRLHNYLKQFDKIIGEAI